MKKQTSDYEETINDIQAEMMAMIKKRMKKLGISQNDLAMTIGKRQTAVSNIFLGRSSPKMETLILMLDALNLTLIATDEKK